MFEWLRRLFQPSPEDQVKQFMQLLDRLNAGGKGGRPVRRNRELGKLSIASGKMSLGDPQSPRDIVLDNVPHGDAIISADLWCYPNGSDSVVGLQVRFTGERSIDSRSVIGRVGIDSAKLVVADKDELDIHWATVGPDRIGSISTARDDALHQDLKRRFKLKTRRVNGITAQLIEPVSPALEKEILDYLQTIPRYANFPFMYFDVRTNNSFERVNFRRDPWAFLPIGNLPEPLMFYCETGRGDGQYDVVGGYSGNSLREISITFIDPDVDTP